MGVQYLRKLKHNNQFYNLIFYDTETSEIKHNQTITKDTEITHKLKLKLGVVNYYSMKTKHNFKYNERDKKTYFNNDDFVEFCISKINNNLQNFYIFAHNHGFDFRISGHSLFKYLIEEEQYQTKFINLDPFIFILEKTVYYGNNSKRNKKIVFLDSMNYYRNTSLKQLGKIFNLEKLEINFNKCSLEELEKYCDQDVEILTKSVIHLLTICKDIKKGYTISSMALNMFRTLFMDTDICLIDDEEIIKLESNGYYGGRTEVFQVGKIEQVYKLDINSLYPSVMLDNLYPIQKKTFYMDNKGDLSKKLLQTNDLFITDVLIKTKINSLAKRQDGKLIFPIGTFRTVLTNIDLANLDKKDYEILKIYRFVSYRSQKIFNRYVKFFYNKRVENKNNQSLDMLYKYFLNVLYGKFGERNQMINRMKDHDGEHETGRIHTTIEGIKNSLTEIYFVNGIAFSKSQERKTTDHTFISIPVFVCSYARNLMFQNMKKTGLENLYYTNTDSIFTNEKGVKNLSNQIDNNKLGYLKIEEFGNCEIYNLKDYVFNKKVYLKGIPKDAKKIGKNKYEIIRLSGLKESINNYNNEIMKIKTKKVLQRVYKKGILNQETNRITPFILNEISN